jgi:hypothetical protein
MNNKIVFKGVLNDSSIDIIKNLIGLRISSINIKGGNISFSNNLKLTTSKQISFSLIDTKDILHLILNNSSYKPNPLIWEQSRLTIQSINESYKPLSEKLLWPSHSLDSSFSSSITGFDKEAKVKTFKAYGNKFEGIISNLFPTIDSENYKEANISKNTELFINSIELLEIALEDNFKIFVILRENGFELEISDKRQLNEIVDEYFDERYNLQLQHSISK